MPMSGLTSSCCSVEGCSRSCAIGPSSSLRLRSTMPPVLWSDRRSRPGGEDRAVAGFQGAIEALLDPLLEPSGPQVVGEGAESFLSRLLVQAVPEGGVPEVGR